MNTNTIDAPLMAKMFLAGAGNLERNKESINELNVFPVPDGDTGTNMTLTIMSAVREVSSLDVLTMKSFSKAVSSGSLRGARGNSGVILSQLLRGFTNVIRSEDEITTRVLAAALDKSVDTAYKAVMKPKEGTILTVARCGAECAGDLLESDPDISMEDLLTAILHKFEETLKETPDLLPILKEAGVVDSGGQGLLEIFRGMYDAYLGKEVPAYPGGEEPMKTERSPRTEDASYEEEKRPIGAAMDAEITYGYCTEFIIMLESDYTEETEEEFKAYLSSIGDSLVVVSDDDLVKVHVHTNDPGLAIQRALTYGSLTSMKIDNMRLEHNERVIHEEERRQAAEKEKAAAAEEKGEEASSSEEKGEPEKETAFITVSLGDGIAEIFRDLGVDYLIEGGQTMNPSTEDMLNAINKVHAKNIFILPNNKNVILAANQAKSLTRDKNVFVIPTTTIPQGITAVINYVPEKTPAENASVMEQEILHVQTGQLTYAIRDTHIEDKVISAGDIMGVGDHSILSVGKEVPSVAFDTVEAMMNEDAELISIYYGEDMNREEAEAFGAQIAGLYPQCDVEVNYGGQPIYYYIISVE